MQDAEKESNCYEWYQKLGGIINEKDFQNALDRINNARTLDRRDPQIRNSILQAVGIARCADIKLNDSEDAVDPRIVLYVILRADAMPEGIRYHHSQMSDQRLFAEALRMLGDVDSLNKLINTHPHISFN